MLSSVVICACSGSTTDKMLAWVSYGAKLSPAKIETFQQVKNELKTSGQLKVKVSGIISDFDKNKGFWLLPFKKGADPIFVAIDQEQMDLPGDVKGKVVVVEGAAVKVITTEIKHVVKAGNSVNVQVWCPHGIENKESNNCITVGTCPNYSMRPGIEYLKNDLGEPLLQTKITATGLLVMGY